MVQETPHLAFDLAKHVPNLAPRTTIRLHPRRGEAAWDRSKLGGAIAWPADEPWLRCQEHDLELVPVLQLRREDVPELPFPPATDLFQLLWCPSDHPDVGYGPRPVARWRALGPDLRPRQPAGRAGGSECYTPNACTLAPERVQELPSAFELGAETVNELDRLIAARAAADLARLGVPEGDPLYHYHYSVAPGTKARGYVNWIQDPDVPTCNCGARMEHLVTIASAEFDGAYQRWMPEAERSVWRQGYEARSAVQSAAGLMIGDMGSLFVFVCGRCPERPIRGIAQSS